MRAVIQRVSSASVISDGILTGKIGQGLMLLLGVAKGDEKLDAELLAAKIAKLRIFSDENDKMNRSVMDIGGSALVVSNFTLSANYSHGNRPDYFGGAAPAEADRLYEYFKGRMSSKVKKCESGIFGADMTISASCDGPVTIVMDSNVLKKKKA